LDEDGCLPVTTMCAGTCDEELEARGARALARSPGARADLAVVAEPTDLAIVHAHKGTIRWRIRTLGIPAHSSAPERGVNAISHMARVIAMLEQEGIPALAARRHPLLGAATLSVGTIRGGTQVNVVPAECVLNVDRRLLPGESREEATAEVRARLEALAARVPGMRWSVEALQYYEPIEVPPDAPVCRLVAAACERTLGEARFATAPWSSDAGVLAAAGIPCILMGPGSIQQAHTHDEFIELRELERGVAVYAAIIRQTAKA
jgi:acetylornithine deacetylase